MAPRPVLAIDSKARPAKKYLGDPSSPHFIPISPLVDRQFLTLEDEEALKRACAAALKDIQSSDDDVDQSIAYLAGQIQEKEKHAGKSSDNATKAAPAAAPVDVASSKIESVAHEPEYLHVANDAPASSEPSRRTTAVATDFSTPLTSAGITPGATDKKSSGMRFGFLSVKRGSESSQGGAVDPKSTERSSTWMANYLEKRISKDNAEPARKSTSRPSTNRTTSRVNIRGHSNQGSASTVDLNKRLPQLPGESPEPQIRKPHISRIMKSMRRPMKTEAVRHDGQESIEHDETSQIRSRPILSQQYQMKSTMLESNPARESETIKDDQHSPLFKTSAPPLERSATAPLPMKRRFFTKRFAGHFEWKRRKVPPVLQVA